MLRPQLSWPHMRDGTIEPFSQHLLAVFPKQPEQPSRQPGKINSINPPSTTTQLLKPLVGRR